jgi:hypothetical protein
MKKPAQHLIAEVPRRQSRVEMTIGIDLGDVWSHYCTLNEEGEVVDRGRFRTTPKGLENWFADLPPARVAMEAGTHSIWIRQQLQELGHHVILENVRELRSSTTWDRLDIVVGGTSEVLNASVVHPGQATVPSPVFRGIARTLRFHHGGVITIALSPGSLRIDRTDYRHPSISVLAPSRGQAIDGTNPAKLQNR